MQVGFEKPGSPEEVLLSLEHHGVKGQKWGVRQKEETSSDRTSSKPKTASNKKSSKSEPISERKEQKAKQADADAVQIQKHIDKIKKSKPSSNRYVQRQRNNQVKELEKVRDQRIKDAKDIRAGHLTTHQKHVLIGVGVTVGVLAAYGTYKYIDYGAANKQFNRDTFTKLNPLLKNKMSPEDIMKHVVEPINPGFHEGAYGSRMNCRRCTFAYELRRRGYDVRASTTRGASGQTVSGLLNATNPQSNLNTSIFGVLKDNADPGSPVHKALKTSMGSGKEGIDLRSGMTFLDEYDRLHRSTGPNGTEKASAIFKALAKQPDGARGELGVIWHQGGGHSMAWEVIDGIPNVFDTQTGDHYNVGDFGEKIGPAVKDAGLTRLDNISLNNDYLRRWVKNV